MPNKLELFNESVGYETYLIINSLKEFNRISGISEHSGISFVSHSYKTHTMTITDTIGGDNVSRYILENLLPLIFTSSFKILDMFIEYLIRINGNEVPWQFKLKIYFLETHFNSMSFPDEFEIKINRCIFDLYKILVNYRNMLIHGAWGEFRDGIMLFKKNDEIFELSKDHILALSNIAQMIIRVLNNDQDSIYMNGYKSTLARELNCFADKFGEEFERFPEKFVIYHKIHYLLNEDDEEKIVISEIMKVIESSLEAQKRFYPTNEFSIVFEVFVEKLNTVWRIPSNKLSLSCDEIQLNEFQDYKLSYN